MILTSEQEQACDEAMAFLAHPFADKPYFTVHGLAGTGKTTVMCELARRLQYPTLVAPTGKAAAVLRSKSGLEVKTIHSAIYDFLGTKKDDKGKRTPMFAAKDLDAAELFYDVILLDESSMVGEYLAKDLLKTGAKIIAFGDPGQLPPVRDRQFFAQADFTLTTIHRQALESAIIRQAWQIRNGENVRSDGDDFKIVRSLDGVDLASFDIVLCWKNDTRKTENKYIRQTRKIDNPALQPGEPVMCLRNHYGIHIFNGEIYRTTAERPLGQPLYLSDESKSFSVNHNVVEGFESVEQYDAAWDDDDYTPFALAYCSTVHKAQGAEFKRVLVFDEMPIDHKDRRSLLYTAVTRASKHVTLYRP